MDRHRVYNESDNSVIKGDKVMPKETFIKLPQEKKNTILNAAVKEFQERRVEDAIIANIIKTAKIPRGSFYQYFNDIYDLYEYIIGYIEDIKTDYFQGIFLSDHLPFLDRVRLLIDKAIDFASQNKAFVFIGKRHSESVYVKYSIDLQKRMNDLKTTFDLWIDTDKERNLIRKEVDTRTLSHAAVTFFTQLVTEFYLYEKYTKNELKVKNECLIDILKNGVKFHV